MSEYRYQRKTNRQQWREAYQAEHTDDLTYVTATGKPAASAWGPEITPAQDDNEN